MFSKRTVLTLLPGLLASCAATAHLPPPSPASWPAVIAVPAPPSPPVTATATPDPVAAPASPSDAGPYTAILDALDAEHVGYVTGSESGFYVEAGIPWLCLPAHEHAEGQSPTLGCWAWPHELRRVEGDVSSKYDSNGTLAEVTVQARDAIVVLKSSSTKDGAPKLTVSSVRVRASVQRSTLADSLDYTMPPSRRPHPRPNPWKPGFPGLHGAALASARTGHALSVAHALETLHEGRQSTRIRSAEYAGTSLVSLSLDDGSGGYEEVWTCQRSRNGPRTCMRSDSDARLGDFIAIDREKTVPVGWLLLAKDSWTPRAANNALVWVSVHDGAMKAFEILVGGVGGIGSHCDPGDGEGYCMSMSGTWTPFDIVAPDCVRIRQSTHWSAVHDRAADRWLHETIDPATDTDPEPGTYRAGPDGWKRVACASSASPLAGASGAP